MYEAERLRDPQERLYAIEDIVNAYTYRVTNPRGEQIALVPSGIHADQIIRSLNTLDMLREALNDPDTTLDDIRAIAGSN